jgi:chromodomain-helicase-DNA-binding protein 3
MKCIGWEAVIVDDCQSSRVLKCLEQLTCLHTDFRMVLLSSPLKVLSTFSPVKCLFYK